MATSNALEAYLGLPAQFIRLRDEVLIELLRVRLARCLQFGCSSAQIRPFTI